MGAQVIEGMPHLADESEAEMRLLTHLVSSAVCFHGTLAQEQIDEILELTVPFSLPGLTGQPIQN